MTRDHDSSTDETLSSLGDRRADERARVLARGEAIGRYVVIDRIGEGGMGVVYAAYDPELDRKLALKLLHHATGDRAEARRTRLVREAQAMARLSHRNVIVVHDVGMVDDALLATPPRLGGLKAGPAGPLVFVAMEFIDGHSLAQWMTTARPWRAVLDVFVQAGRGLAAAHDAGLVHRDFKPDNVMIAHDGRVVVTDFGLARAAGTADESSAQHPIELVPRLAAKGTLAATVTAQGAIMGTPAYMAPEQHEGRVADARSDQFSFAVALYEALYRQRPFAGEDFASLAYHVTSGHVREPPAGADVPGWLAKVVQRALAVAPEARYASMHALLAELSRDRSVRPRWWAVFLGVGASAATGLYAGAMIETDPAPCTGAAQEIAEVWNREKSDEIHARFFATNLPYVEEQWPTVRAELDGWAESWSLAYVDACEDTHVRGEQSEALLDTRMLCLARHREGLEAVVELFANADASVVQGALAAVQGLPNLRACEQIESLLDPVPPPADPVTAGKVDSLRPELARVAALGRAGLHDVGLGAARDLVARTAETDYGPLHGEALEHLAAFERASGQWADAETHLREAVAVALRGRADMIAARAAVDLVEVVGHNQTDRTTQRARRHDAVAWAELAEALLERAGGDPELEIALFDSRARMLEASGELDAAREQLERLLAIRERSHGSEDVRVADTAVALGDVVARLGDVRRARELYERALSIDEYAVGLEHPKVGEVLTVLGRTCLRLGDVDAALDHLARAVAVGEAQGKGDDALALVRPLTEMGRAYTSLGRMRDAGEALDRALAIAVEDPRAVDAASVASVHVALAELALARGEPALAIEQAGRARTALGSDAPAVQAAAIDLVAADALLEFHRADEARTRGQAALAALTAALGEEDPALVDAWLVIGRADLELDAPSRALDSLERALAVARERALPSDRTAAVEQALADALWSSGRDHPRALDLARDARDRLAPDDARQRARRDALDRWLAKNAGE